MFASRGAVVPSVTSSGSFITATLMATVVPCGATWIGDPLAQPVPVDPFSHLDHVHIPCACGDDVCGGSLVVGRDPDGRTLLIVPTNAPQHFGIQLDAQGIKALATELIYHLRSMP